MTGWPAGLLNPAPAALMARWGSSVCGSFWGLLREFISGSRLRPFLRSILKAMLAPQFGFKRDQEGTRKPEAQKKREEKNRKGASKNSGREATQRVALLEVASHRIARNAPQRTASPTAAHELQLEGASVAHSQVGSTWSEVSTTPLACHREHMPWACVQSCHPPGTATGTWE